MRVAAPHEFQSDAVKYESTALTYNGQPGRLWTKRVLSGGAWVHQGKQHVRKSASKEEVMRAFDADDDGA